MASNMLDRCQSYGDMENLEARNAQHSSGERQDALARYVLSAGVDLNSAAHIRRYEEAAQFVAGRRVIDCACGPGYGSAILAAHGAKYTVGMDCHKDSIRYAQEWYEPGVHTFFAWAEAQEIIDVSHNWHYSGADCVVSLETIEHLAEPEAFVDAVSELLGADGIFVVSLPEVSSRNAYHINDWTAADVAARYPGRLHIIT